MTKIIAKLPCDKPDCTHPHEMEIDYTEPKIPKADVTITASTPAQQTVLVQEQKPQNPETQKDHHQMLAESMPKGVNFGRCTGENCNKKIKNAKGLTTKFKTCSNCDRNAVAANKKDCPFCGSKFDPEDEPDIDDISDKIEDENDSAEE